MNGKQSSLIPTNISTECYFCPDEVKHSVEMLARVGIRELFYIHMNEYQNQFNLIVESGAPKGAEKGVRESGYDW